MKLISKIRHFLKPASIYQKVKNVYFKVAPTDSKQYQLTNSIIRRVLKKFQLLNIYYGRWIKAFDTLSEANREQIKIEIRAMKVKPLISIVMPVYNPEISFFKEAIQSVKDQLYPHWELCIADDASTDLRIPNLIAELALEDQRVKFIIREENGHISACSNSAFSLAKGDYIALLDHDDKLHPLALFHVAQAINQYPDCRIIYSDEDKITKRGNRMDPYFKPDFDYELLLSQNMISHLGVYRAEILQKLGGFRLGLEGSQDYDLLLRVLEQIEPDQIHHIPRILYHWRISKHSVAESLNIKPYAIQAGERAINEHLERKGIRGKAEFLEKTSGYRINYTLPDPGPRITLIIPVFKNTKIINRLINEISINTHYDHYQIVLIQFNISLKSEEISPTSYQKGDRIILHEISENTAYPQAINECVNEVSTDYIAILNPNLTGFSPGWLSTLLGQAIQDKIGAVAPKLIDQNKYIQSNGIIMTPDNRIHHLFQGKFEDFNGYFGWGKLRKGYSALSEKCIVISKIKFKAVGGFESDFLSPSNSTLDFCLKLKKSGLRNILCPSIKLYIQEDNEYNSVRKQTDLKQYQEGDALFKQKWERYFLDDPGFNPNLTIAQGGEVVVNLSPKKDQIPRKDLHAS